MLKGAKYGSSKFPQYIKKLGKINYWNQSSKGNVIHKDDEIFPILVETLLIFPISWALPRSQGVWEHWRVPASQEALRYMSLSKTLLSHA